MFLANVLLSAALLAPPEAETAADSVRRTLDQAVAFDFAFNPLPEVAAALSKRQHIPVVVDELSFTSEVGQGPPCLPNACPDCLELLFVNLVFSVKTPSANGCSATTGSAGWHG